MTIEYVKQKMKELKELAKTNPNKKLVYRLQWRSLKCALDFYYKEHPQTDPADN